MADVSMPDRAAAGKGWTPAGLLVALVPLAIFTSAGLIFLVEPLIARLLLPRLGGSPAVWNTCLVFFQACLLVGYSYAHLLQRIRSVRVQAGVHLVVLALAALSLPLQLSGAVGEPSADAPVLWTLTLLTLTLGAPFATLSATAPLLQAWWAAAFEGKRNPYALYAASNVGSLAGLLAYPLLVEPLVTLQLQQVAWTIGYGLFALVALGLAISLPNAKAARHAATVSVPLATRWRQRAWWALLGAIPSSLLLGVTSHLTVDVASAPFLWVVPLALYLVTFILAFRDRKPISKGRLLFVQGAAVAACLTLLHINFQWWVALPLHLLTFFTTALLCHRRLADDRPDAGRLTEFYLALSVGGVLGGAFNALLAPVIFDLVWEYPLALILATVVRPLGPRRPTWGYLVLVAMGLVGAAAAIAGLGDVPLRAQAAALAVTASAAFLLRDRAPGFVIVLIALTVAGSKVAGGEGSLRTERSFFGVYGVQANTVPDVGPVTHLSHGTTLHGAQFMDARRCTPMTYYAPGTPMAQSVRAVQASGAARIGVVGLGAGSLAAYTRPGDTLRFYEIDPVVVDLADTAFSYLGNCAAGRIDTVVGDARLTVAREPAGAFDLLIIDAFSSDTVPTHLMTTEAMRVWLDAVAEDGALVFHISNRNLELEGPVVAALKGAGASNIAVQYRDPPGQPSSFVDAASRVVVATADAQTFARLQEQGPWTASVVPVAAPWTDDRTDVLGALIRMARINAAAG